MFGLGAWEAAIIVMVLFVAAVLACVFLVWRVGFSASKHNSDLVSCPKCQRQISREYASCPQCGQKMPSANDVSGQLAGRSPTGRSTV
jgi:predicted amidophosphoribosyltransferase